MRAYARHGDFVEAAAELGLAHSHVKNVAYDVYQKLGVNSAVEAYVVLGWLRIPDE